MPSEKSTKKNSSLDELSIDDRLERLEVAFIRLDTDINNLAMLINELNERLRKTQEFSVKIGHAQNRIHEYISHWPFVRVVKDHGQDFS
jgi:hypothetical protein